MAFAPVAASGFLQQLCRTSSNGLLVSSSLQSHRQWRRHFPSSANLPVPDLCSHFPFPPLPRYPSSSSAVGFRCLLSSPTSATGIPISRRNVTTEEDDEESGNEISDVTYDDDDLSDEEEEDMGEVGTGVALESRPQMEGLDFGSSAAEQQLPRYPSPKLSIKEKKELAAFAHSLGKKLKSQQVGKSGITPSLIAAFIETLEANELLKLKVHGNCPGELPEVINQLEVSTGSVAVGRIGRSVILYRPSVSKMQEKQLRPVQKTWRPRPKEQASGLRLQKKGPLQRLSSRVVSSNHAK